MEEELEPEGHSKAAEADERTVCAGGSAAPTKVGPDSYPASEGPRSGGSDAADRGSEAGSGRAAAPELELEPK